MTEARSETADAGAARSLRDHLSRQRETLVSLEALARRTAQQEAAFRHCRTNIAVLEAAVAKAEGRSTPGVKTAGAAANRLAAKRAALAKRAKELGRRLAALA